MFLHLREKRIDNFVRGGVDVLEFEKDSQTHRLSVLIFQEEIHDSRRNVVFVEDPRETTQKGLESLKTH